jgi:hypothetical protein
MSDAQLVKLTKDWNRTAGAAPEALATFRKRIRRRPVPEDYLEFMRHSDGASGLAGCEGPWIRLYNLDEVWARTREHHAPAGLLLVGTSNRWIALAFDTRGRQTTIVLVPFGEYAECQLLGTTLAQALVELAKIGRQLKRAARRARKPDVPFVATPQDVVECMLKVGKVKEDDLLYDLGCGDGRLLITAARKYGARAVGFDVDARRIRQARANVKKAGVRDLVRIHRRNIFSLDLSKASVITLYLMTWMNERLVSQLLRLPVGVRIVSHDFPVADFKPKRTFEFTDSEGMPCIVYLWVTPL